MTAASEHPGAAAWARHVSPQFARLLGVLGYGRVLVRGRGSWLWDSEGRSYLDALAGYGTFNLGHNHPRLLERLREVLAADPVHFVHTGPALGAGALGQALAGRVAPPLELTLLSSSGAEAVEAGLKVACAATRRREVVYCQGGFHGTNLGVLSIMGAPRMRRPFEAMLAPARAVPFGALEPLERALRGRKVAAFVVEPVQAEGGVMLPPPGYLAAAQELCRRAGTVLVLDEVQTGLGRTGTLWAYQQEGLVPDVLVLAKALSGGVVPVAATLLSRELHDRAYGGMDRFDLHGSTFAGGALACAAACATLELVDDEGLAERSRTLGARLLQALTRGLAGHPLVKAVRGRGLLVGIELGHTERGLRGLMTRALVDGLSERVFGQWLALELLERGVLAQPAALRWNVLKLEPPLIVDEAEVDQLARVVVEALEVCREPARMMAAIARRVGRQWRQGWAY
ncbi:MAG: aspartate aminotransferase family protein [Deltaproteobacteria bacterium]|nr:aspartate aminotransferase family protein [Deltaproteobacteria bacterium]